MGAFAQTTNTPLQTKAVGTSTEEYVGDLRIAETSATKGSVKSGHTITFNLLDGAKFYSHGSLSETNFNGTTADLEVVSRSQNSISVKLKKDIKAFTDGALDFKLGSVRLDLSSLTGDSVKVEVYSPNGGVTNGNVVVGTVASGSTNATVLSTSTFSKGKTGQNAGTVRIVENRAGALKAGKTVKVSIPTDSVEFTSAPTVKVINPDTNVQIIALDKDGNDTGSITNLITTSITPPAYESGDGYSEFAFKVKQASGGAPANFEITGIKITVEDDASEGDVKIKVAGDATSQTLILGTTKTYGYSITAEDVISVMAGDDTETLEDIIIKEDIAATIIGNGRTIKFTLPEDVAWVEAPSVNPYKGNGLTLNAGTISDNGRTVTYAFDNTNSDFSVTTSTFKFEDGKIAVKASAAEKDVVITVEGSSNVSGEVKVAEIVKPIIVTAQKMDVQVGKQSQAIGDVLIKEVEAGYLKADKTIEIDLGSPSAGTFAATPKVEVVEGDLKIDQIDKTSGKLTITIDRISTEPSTIKITGITVDLDRTPAEGDYKMRVYGTAINKVHAKYNTDPMTPANEKIIGSKALDTSATNGVSFVGMTVVTPAQDGVVKPVVMTVGSTVYTIDGVEMTMDVAPYIKDSRTYFPVRYVAQALGITADNVVWDGAQRTVTIFRANRIVQVTIGSTTMLVNGVPLTMDVAPEITAERTMLPIRFVAQGLGVNVNWDAATQTVTLN